MTNAPPGSALLAAHAAPLKERVISFMRAASIEITPSEEKHLPALRALLPAECPIFVSHVPTATLAQVVKTALAVQAAGFQATPHLVARRINYPEALRTTLAELVALPDAPPVSTTPGDANSDTTRSDALARVPAKVDSLAGALWRARAGSSHRARGSSTSIRSFG